MFDKIKQALTQYNGEWKEEKSGLLSFSSVIAERKAFLSTKKLTYQAKMRIDEASRSIKFSEMLIERGSGLSSGGDFDGEMSSGFGFKAESYNTLKTSRSGTIQERSDLFGKKFEYKFNYQEIRQKIEFIATESGYSFEYQVLPVK